MRTDPSLSDAPRWRKARASNPDGNCVEIAVLATDRIGVRNSRCPDGGVLVFPAMPFAALLAVASNDALATGQDGRPVA